MNRYNVLITELTQPDQEPITYAQVKSQCRLDDDTERLFLEALITAARSYAEASLSRNLVQRDMQVTHYGHGWTTTAIFPQGLPQNNLQLPRGPVQSITSVVDANGNTVSNTTYQLRRIGNIDYCYLLQIPLFPVTIQYVSGYGEPSAVPMHIKAGMLMHVAHLYRNREAASNIEQIPVPYGLEAIYGIEGSGEYAV